MNHATPRAATYVFAVGRTVDPTALRGLPGLAPGAAVRPLRCGPLTAVVQHLPEEEAHEEAWRARLSDPGALERTARAHHEVVGAVARHDTAVPLALGTVYRGDDRARAALAADAARFEAALRRIDGCDEWGVKVYPGTLTPPPQAPPHTAPHTASHTAPPGAGGGRAYLERRRAEQRERERRRYDAQRAADAVDAGLRVLARDARRLRPHTAQAGGAPAPQVLNAAYLVARSDEAAFARALDALRRRTGARIDVTGPWVPYSFAALADPAGPAHDAERSPV
jgi:hypothetical protein